MKHTTSAASPVTAATLTPAAVAYLVRRQPGPARQVSIGTHGPRIQLLAA